MFMPPVLAAHAPAGVLVKEKNRNIHLMKTRYTISSTTLALVTMGAMAQPSLQYANLHWMGQTFSLHVVLNPGSSNPDPDGADQTWDFSSATLQMNAASCAVTAPAGTPYAAQFPTANMVQAVTVGSSTTYSYFNLTSGQLDMLAENMSAGNGTIYTTPKTPVIFPFAYPDYFIDDYVKDGTSYSVSRAVMGYGTVILPTGTYTDVIKVASTSGAIGFWRTSPVQPLVLIEDDGSAIVWGDGVMSVHEQTSATALLAAWPNPALDMVTVAGPDRPADWSLVDASGRVLREGHHAHGPFVLAVGDLAPGTYLVHMRMDGFERQVRILKD